MHSGRLCFYLMEITTSPLTNSYANGSMSDHDLLTRQPEPNYCNSGNVLSVLNAGLASLAGY